jgi:putative ABC transport system permease protein
VKFIPLVWAGLRRKRSRSLLILAQVIIAFTLFGVLQGLASGVNHAIAAAHADRLYVASKLNLGSPLPIAIVERLRTIPGVAAVAYRLQFGASYQRASQNVPICATDVDGFLAMYPELEVDPAQVRAMRQVQDGAIVGIDTMRKYGWKVGQRVTLQAPLPRKDGTGNWTFDIVGTFENTDEEDNAQLIIAHYNYVNESLPTGAGDTINIGVVRIADPSHAAQVEQAIDSQYANSPNETLTQSEHELDEQQLANFGDLDTVVHRVVTATFFVLLFATGALMMQSIRERTPEIAVLKTLGFSDRRVMALILGETLVLCLTGAAVGLWLATRILPIARSYIGLGSVPPIVVAIGFACAVGLALGGGAMAAWRGLRLRVVDALASR